MCEDAEALSGFIEALSSFGSLLSNGMLSEVVLSGLQFMIMPHNEIIFSISADDDETKNNKRALEKIIDVFADIYDSYSLGIEDEIDPVIYKDFPKFLVDQGVLKLNCGLYVECEGCPNRVRSLPLNEMTKELQSKQ